MVVDVCWRASPDGSPHACMHSTSMTSVIISKAKFRQPPLPCEFPASHSPARQRTASRRFRGSGCRPGGPGGKCEQECALQEQLTRAPEKISPGPLKSREVRTPAAMYMATRRHALLAVFAVGAFIVFAGLYLIHQMGRTPAYSDVRVEVKKVELDRRIEAMKMLHSATQLVSVTEAQLMLESLAPGGKHGGEDLQVLSLRVERLEQQMVMLRAAAQRERTPPSTSATPRTSATTVPEPPPAVLRASMPQLDSGLPKSVREGITSWVGANPSARWSAEQGATAAQVRRLQDWEFSPCMPVNCTFACFDTQRNWGSRASGATTCCSSVLLYILDAVDELLDGVGLPYILSFGTLLGHERDAQLIRWTRDADIVLSSNAMRYLETEHAQAYTHTYICACAAIWRHSAHRLASLIAHPPSSVVPSDHGAQARFKGKHLAAFRDKWRPTVSRV